MKICGLQKTTLLDYPGHVAATIFTGGCNFRCPFCHNSDLLDCSAPSAYSEEEILSFLKKRTGILEGVAITGGEPTLQPDLAEFAGKIHDMGLKVKMDTNGYLPDVLKMMCQSGLVDYVAVDIKTCRERYREAAGIPAVDVNRIEETVDFLMQNSVPYEFRTTVVRELHCEDDFNKIGRWIQGCSRYFLQNFMDSGQVLNPGYSSCTKEELLRYLDIVKPYVELAGLRGVDC